MLTTIHIFLSILGLYFGVGFLFGIYFFIKGASKIDSLILDSKWYVKLLLFPGAIATWPFLILKLFQPKQV